MSRQTHRGERRPARSLDRQLIALGLAFVAPILLLCLVLAPVHVAHEQGRLRADAETLAHELADKLDRDLATVQAMLEALIHAPTLAPGSREEFHAYAARLAALRGLDIVLRAPGGEQLLNTHVPFDQELPGSMLPQPARGALRSGQPHVSTLYFGAVRASLVFNVGAPIHSGPFAGHSLNAEIQPTQLAPVLLTASSHIPWTVGILDQSGRVAAGAALYDPVIAHGLPTEVRRRLVGARGFFRTTIDDQTDVYISFATSVQARWHAVVVVPAAEWDAIQRRTLGGLGVLAAGVLAVSFLLALSISREFITEPIRRLAEQAAALDRAEVPEHIPSNIAEIETVAAAMKATRERQLSSTQRLSASEASWRRLAAATPAGVLCTDASGRCRYVNARFCTITGHDESAILGRGWLDLVHPDDRERLAREWEAALSEGSELSFNCRVDTPTGLPRWVHGVIDRDPHAEETPVEPAGFSCTILDLSERIESESRLQLALELGQMGTGVWDLASGRTTLDQLAARIYGIEAPPEGVQFTALLDLVHPQDKKLVARQLQLVLTSDEPVNVKHRIVRPDGEVRFIRIRGQMLAGPGPMRGTRALGVVFDVTEQVRNEELMEQTVAERTRELAELNARLQEQIRQREEAEAQLSQKHKLEAVGQLTSGLAHDFNNELMIIENGIDLARTSVLSPDGLRQLRMALRACERTKRQIKRLLRFARQEEMRPTVVDLLAAVEEMDDELRHVTGSRIEVAIEIGEVETWQVWSDRDELQWAVLNLAHNARDAMPEGGRLTIAARNVPTGSTEKPQQLGPGDFVAIQVSDTGTGMTPEVKARALEPFFTTKKDGRGTGLGLAGVKRFIDQSNGAIVIRTAVGAGTTVELWLPSAGLEHDGDHAPVHGPAAVAVGLALEILCVDDNADSVDLLGDQLRGLGHTVITATDAGSALAAARQAERLDLLVTDIDMPDMTGPELARAIQLIRPAMPVLFITGNTPRENPENTICKPFYRQELATMVLQATGRAAESGTSAGT